MPARPRTKLQALPKQWDLWHETPPRWDRGAMIFYAQRKWWDEKHEGTLDHEELKKSYHINHVESVWYLEHLVNLVSWSSLVTGRLRKVYFSQDMLLLSFSGRVVFKHSKRIPFFRSNLGGGFKLYFLFSLPTWGNDPISRIFFKWVETTNQQYIFLGGRFQFQFLLSSGF